MAAAILTPVAAMSEPAAQVVGHQVESFLEDPVAFFVRWARILGSVLLAGGFLMGVLGYYLKAAATAALNTEVRILGGIGNIFSNIKAPTFTPAATGTQPVSFSLQGVNNFFSDAWKDVSAVGSDVEQIGAAMGTLGEDVAMGLIDIGKSILAFVMHFPDIAWNGLVAGIGSPIADVLNFAFPWLIIAGGGLLIASMVAQGARWAWKGTVGAAWNESSTEWAQRRKAALKAKFDRALGNAPKVAEISPPTPLPAVPTPPNIDPGPAGEARQTEAAGEEEVVAAPTSVTPAAPAMTEAPPNVVGPTPTAEVEEQLGGHQAIEPTAEELKEQEEARKESLPPEPEAEPEPEEESDTDRQRAILMGPLEA